MAFTSKDQWRAAFGGYLGPEMQVKASAYAHETPSYKNLPETSKTDIIKKAIKLKFLKKNYKKNR